MTVSISDFRPGGGFPEFEKAPDGLVQSKIDDATAGTDAAVFLARTEERIRYLAAELLALSPFGQQARLVSAKGESTYGMRRAQIDAEMTSGFRLAGVVGPVFNDPDKGGIL